MAIRRLPNGSVEFDTVAEFVEYEAHGKPRFVPTPGPAAPNQSVQAEAANDPWLAFVELISGPNQTRQRKVVALIKGRGTAGITIDDLSTQMGDPSLNHTSGTLAGVTKNVKKAGLDPEDVFARDPNNGRLLRAGRCSPAKGCTDPVTV